MEWLAANWFFLLLGASLLYGVAMVFQLRNMKRIVTFEAHANPSSIFAGFVPVVLFGLTGSLLLILSIVGVIKNLIS